MSKVYNIGLLRYKQGRIQLFKKGGKIVIKFGIVPSET